MGVVALVGSRAPSWMKLFLLALAIVDDIGAIVVIAVFYSEGVSFEWLAVAIGAFAAAAIIRSSVPTMSVYLLLGAVCWLALYEAQIHPTLAGVAFGMLAPVTPRHQLQYVDAEELVERPTFSSAYRLSRQARDSVSVVEWLEHLLHPYSAFVVVPIFALANAGVKVPTDGLGDTLGSNVTWGVILGLIVGKTLGITVATMGAVLLRAGRLPPGVTFRYVVGAGALGGIGFTVSLFVTELSFGEGPLGTDARLGVLMASLVAAVVGSAIMVPGRLGDDHSMDENQPVHH
jgi:NhaA family Na+:H+ antiporter